MGACAPLEAEGETLPRMPRILGRSRPATPRASSSSSLLLASARGGGSSSSPSSCVWGRVTSGGRRGLLLEARRVGRKESVQCDVYRILDACSVAAECGGSPWRPRRHPPRACSTFSSPRWCSCREISTSDEAGVYVLQPRGDEGAPQALTPASSFPSCRSWLPSQSAGRRRQP